METKYTLLTKIISSLNQIQVSGANNLNNLLFAIKASSNLVDILKEEDAAVQKELEKVSTTESTIEATKPEDN